VTLKLSRSRQKLFDSHAYLITRALSTCGHPEQRGRAPDAPAHGRAAQIVFL